MITEKRCVEYSKQKMRSGKFSVLTKFLKGLGFGVDVGAEVDNRDEEMYKFDLIETTQFAPKPEYLQKCVESDTVRRYLQISRYRRPVYVITGLKVVTGASANTLRSRTVGGTLAAEVDNSVWSGGIVPLGGRVGLEGKVGSEGKTSWEGSSDFVFAFRVRKVFVGKKMGTVISEEDYKKGAMLGNESEKLNLPELFISREENPDAEDERFDKEELREGEDLIACGVLRRVDSSDSE
ncbi:hypothetical protein G7Z17_g6987 [Cylindrodendrum hubeiense]|uniref:Uncharacterized protein n=1 Tax=Cylindrodendrum hubeiense TaxID=595255 RepID=A0A9P5H8T0_9HYPO|nr:hypothetical protein G7Z17_g6987 [Cylindrodendrum hubeiense]